MLFVVLAFEMSFFGRLEGAPERDLLLTSLRLIVFALVVVGEWRALHALDAGRATAADKSWVTTALVAEAVILAVIPLVTTARSLYHGLPDCIRPYFEGALRGLLILVGLALLFLGGAQILS